VQTNDRWELTRAYLHLNNYIYAYGATTYNADSSNQFRNIEFKRYHSGFNVDYLTRFGDTISIYNPSLNIAYSNGFFYGTGWKTVYGNNIAFIVKIDTLGNFLWEKEYLTTYNDVRSAFIRVRNNKLYICGNVIGSPSTDVFLIETDTSGNDLWTQYYDGNINTWDNVLYFDLTSDNGFILSTNKLFSGTNYKAVIYKLDSTGSVSWNSTIGYNFYWHALGCRELPDGTFICSGTRENQSNVIMDSWFVKLSNTGTVIKDTTIQFSIYKDLGGNIEIRNNEIWVLGASLRSDGSNITDTYVASFDLNFNYNWVRMYGVRHINAQYFGFQTNGSYTTLCGFVTDSDSTNTYDDWFMVLDNWGCDMLNCNVGINENYFDSEEIIIYPNPSVGLINIESNKKILTVEIIDLNGKTIFSSYGNPYITTIDATSLIAGLYLMRLKTEDDWFLRKIVIQK
jgi:hypothetical protein